MNSDLSWTAPSVRSTSGEHFAVRHVWCVGRNYAEHAREMGVEPTLEPPLFFAKPAQAVVQSDRIDYPRNTRSLHHEVELAVLLAAGGRDVRAEDWPERIWGHAVAVDLTRRDLQSEAKAGGRPWELSKGFDQSAPLGGVIRASDWRPSAELRIELSVNGELRQFGRLGEMIWPVAQLLERLSAELTLNPGDVVLTGTPAGVGPLERGDRVEAMIEGLPPCRFTMV
jgi:fumarylpyruvate hydrolase